MYCLARCALELALLHRDEMFVFRRGRGRCFLALAQRAIAAIELLFEPLDRALTFCQRRFTPGERLLERGGLLAPLVRLALGLHQELVRFFLGFEEGFFPARFRLALAVPDDPLRLFFGAADRFGGNAFLVGDPPGEDGSGGGEGHDPGHDRVQHYR